MPRCRAHNRDGTRCKSHAVTGYPVCRMHGAGSPHQGRPGGRPIVHGAYSRFVNPHLARTLRRMRARGATPQDMTLHLRLAQALARARARRSAHRYQRIARIADISLLDEKKGDRLEARELRGRTNAADGAPAESGREVQCDRRFLA